MRRFAILAVLLLFGAAIGGAQDFRKVVEVVDQMETSLRKLIDAEQKERKAEITALRAELAKLQSEPRGVDSTRSSVRADQSGMGLESLRHRLDLLDHRVDVLHDDVAQVAKALSLLVGELKKNTKESDSTRGTVH